MTPRGLTAVEYLLLKTVIDPITGCWIWQGSPSDRYARLSGHNKYGTRSGHRLSYETFIGPIPDGLTLDHGCRNTKCINPEHLEPVTQKVNLERAPTALATINAAKARCKRGHDAWYVWRGHRQCRQCKLNHQTHVRNLLKKV